VELAAWLDKQGDGWWRVDGDPFLAGSGLFLPCPGDELAAFLRRLDRHVLVEDCRPEPQGKGEVIDHTKLDDLTTTFGGQSPRSLKGDEPLSLQSRILYFTWKDCSLDWMLIEDLEGTALDRRDAAEIGEQ
jgi:hypothetical protein